MVHNLVQPLQRVHLRKIAQAVWARRAATTHADSAKQQTMEARIALHNTPMYRDNDG
jgi:hypothetical protein